MAAIASEYKFVSNDIQADVPSNNNSTIGAQTGSRNSISNSKNASFNDDSKPLLSYFQQNQNEEVSLQLWDTPGQE